MATKFKITIGDSTEIYTVKPKHVLRAERDFDEASPVESTYQLAWLASGTEVPFEEWIDVVDDIDPILDGEVVDEPGPTTKGSRQSRS
jgi:hypothetical protein